MMELRRNHLLLAAAIAALSTTSFVASAQTYPSRPITIIVGTGPGGPSDVIARIVAEQMRGSLGQAVIVENVTGANGTIGLGRVARAKPDGYTLAFSGSATHVYNAAIYALTYDVINDFEPIALLSRDIGQLVVAKKAMPANNLKELIAWLKANPDKGSLGHTGSGSPAHVAGIFFQKQTGTRFQNVSYRSAGQAMQDVTAGHIDMMFSSGTIAVAPVQAGSIKAYAVMAKKRVAATPQVPTVDEAGLPGFYSSGWQALWVPKGTPRDMIARINSAVVEVLAETAVRERLESLGLELWAREQQTPEALRAFHKAETEKWWPLLKEADVKPE
jgi:tripartite-type tricarboxylate transporter receptor subunit TctC